MADILAIEKTLLSDGQNLAWTYKGRENVEHDVRRMFKTIFLSPFFLAKVIVSFVCNCSPDWFDRSLL